VKYKEALAWLYSLQRFGIKLGLENIRRLIAEMHVDLGGARVIHVAGTNGKGSVCAMIDSICRAKKYRTGLFISPHLVTFRERIRIGGEMISENEVAAGLTNIRKLVADWEPHPTFFEIATVLSLKHFTEAKIDVVILETGLGGRLDATNAVQSNVAVITPGEDCERENWNHQSANAGCFGASASGGRQSHSRSRHRMRSALRVCRTSLRQIANRVARRTSKTQRRNRNRSHSCR